MKHLCVIFVFLFSLNTVFAQTSTSVISHNKVTIVTNPKKGSNSFKKWAVFPEKNKAIRRITMNVTLAYPEDLAIAHWDYMDEIKILRQGGVEGAKTWILKSGGC